MSDRGGPAAVDTGAVDDSDQDLGEDETSSAENSNTSKAVNSDAVSSQGQPQYENEDLRLLTEKGVCSPLARTSKAAQLGGPEEQAPAMFAVPVSIKKQFAPPFVVRVGVISNLPTQIKATVAAYVLNQEQVAKLETWHPAYHAVTEPLAGAVVTQAIVCHNAVYRMPPLDGVQAPAPESHSGFADFTFSELKFMSSSRMKPRWLVFALTLPTDDVMFVQYTVPTIVMSRQCDQQGKALSLLRGQLPWRKRARAPDKPDRAASLPLSRPSASDSQSAQQAQQARSARQQAKHEQQQRVGPLEDDILDGEWPVNGPYTFERWRDTIERTCKYHHLIRSFDMEDMKMLAQVAGFFAPGTVGRAALETTPGAWQNFGNWFLSYLRLFRCHQQLWCMRNPTAICSFSVDRRKAEQLLFNQPVGTFILRPSLSLCGTMVISCVADGRIKHMALDANQLDSRSLEVWVRDVIEAQQLLDVGSGQRYAKCQVFLLHYRRFGVVMDLTKDALSQMFSAHLPADMLGPGC
ncbi:hypothetical protein WJX72_010360 [[Myrmecia] bisecta]|uniref:SH2 domain-containing protein n=1 Tax=[Myrmecia] bisecta TaxID=41462 RepID=A0AAW1PD33_9CHLO